MLHSRCVSNTNNATGNTMAPDLNIYRDANTVNDFNNRYQSYTSDMARLDRIEQNRIESFFGALAGRREDADAALAIAGLEIIQNTSIAIVGGYLAGAAASSSLVADAAAAREFYAVAKSAEEINAAADVAAAYETQAAYARNAASAATGLVIGLATAKNRTDAALGAVGTAADLITETHGVGLTGIAIPLTQATLEYIKQTGVSDAQAAAIVAGIHRSVEHTRQAVVQRYFPPPGG